MIFVLRFLERVWVKIVKLLGFGFVVKMRKVSVNVRSVEMVIWRFLVVVWF